MNGESFLCAVCGQPSAIHHPTCPRKAAEVEASRLPQAGAATSDEPCKPHHLFACVQCASPAPSDAARLPTAPAGFKLLKDSTHDERSWPEDFSHENGNYSCLCCHCDRMFTGHKRRAICKVCAKDDGAALAAAPGARQPLSEMRWIPVSERLPTDEDAVSCEAWCKADEEGDVAGPCVMSFDEGEWNSREDTGCWEPGEVTHWRPRPNACAVESEHGITLAPSGDEKGKT